MSNQHILRAQLIYLNRSTLLLPNMAVAEVTRFDGLEPLSAAPLWVHGLIQWRGLSLPLIDVDALINGDNAVLNKNPRIVVLNSLSGHREISFIAIATAGNPHLMKLLEDVVDNALAEEHSSRYIHAQYPLGKKNVWVPNLHAIEEALVGEASNLVV